LPSLANTGKEVIYGASGGLLPTWALRVVQITSGAALAFTCWVLWKHLYDQPGGCWKNWFYVCWVWWVFAPPTWFSFEYFYLFKPSKAEGTFEAFKYGQELASRAWLGIAAVMTVIASK
jgi:hypothetical protein